MTETHSIFINNNGEDTAALELHPLSTNTDKGFFPLRFATPDLGDLSAFLLKKGYVLTDLKLLDIPTSSDDIEGIDEIIAGLLRLQDQPKLYAEKLESYLPSTVDAQYSLYLESFTIKNPDSTKEYIVSKHGNLTIVDNGKEENTGSLSDTDNSVVHDIETQELLNLIEEYVVSWSTDTSSQNNYVSSSATKIFTLAFILFMFIASLDLLIWKTGGHIYLIVAALFTMVIPSLVNFVDDIREKSKVNP